MARYRRSLTIDRSLRWQLHRRQHFARRRIAGWFTQAMSRQRAVPHHASIGDPLARFDVDQAAIA